MSTISSVEDAYQALAREIMEFLDGRPWDVGKGVYQVLTKSTSHEWLLVKDGNENEKGKAPSFNASDALFFLRDNLFKTTGQRIWGLTFTLYPDGKFNIEYDYNKPEGYEESDETISLEEALGGLPGSCSQNS